MSTSRNIISKSNALSGFNLRSFGEENKLLLATLLLATLLLATMSP